MHSWTNPRRNSFVGDEAEASSFRAPPPLMNLFRKVLTILTAAARPSALWLLFLMIVGMVLETLGIGLVIPTVVLLMEGDLANKYPRLGPVLASLGHPTQAQLISGGMLVLFTIYLVKDLFLAFFAWRQTKFVFDVQADVSQRLFAKYIHQPYSFHLQRNSAQLIQNSISEVSLFSFQVILPLMIAVTEGLVVIGIAGLLLAIEPVGAIIIGLLLGGASWGFQRITRSGIARWGAARQLNEGLRLHHIQQGLGGVKDVKLLGREAEFLNQFRVNNLEASRVGRLSMTLQMLPRLWLELLAIAGLCALVLIMQIQGRNMAALVPALGMFAVAAYRLLPSVMRLLQSAQTVKYYLPVINTLHNELALDTAEAHPLGRSMKMTLESEVELSNIRYTYPSTATEAISDISISIRKGEAVGIVGASGSGKSTLVDVLLGLLTPCAGEINVDGRNIQKNIRAWQDQIGYVPQSIYLTDDSILRNVAFGIPPESIDETAVRCALKAAQLDEFVGSLPLGLETLVGERGVRLSGGQRQRIGIARALYHDPAVLVLDEATSALDTATERGVIEAVTALQGAKTVIIIAHRLSTVEHCDRIYKLERGVVVEEGSPADILFQSVTNGSDLSLSLDQASDLDA